MCPGCMGGQPLGCDKLIIKVDSLLENRTDSIWGIHADWQKHLLWNATSIHSQDLQVTNSDVGVHTTCINGLIQSIALEFEKSYSPKPVTKASIALK